VPDEASLALIGPASDLLFIDIETTGLSRENNHVYLIGCAYYQPEGWHMIQWFDNTGIDENGEAKGGRHTVVSVFDSNGNFINSMSMEK
jgi:hypothetical protein